MTTAIEGFELRNAGTGDASGAFLHAPQKDFTAIKFANEQVDILCQIDNKYDEHIEYEGKNKVIYLMLNQAMHGTLTAALLWYELLTKTLIKNSFKLNPCDLCVANNQINGRQCIIICHVDDAKLSCMEPNVVTNVFNLLETHFRKMKITRGKVHAFLGMKITYEDNRRFSLGIKPYLEQIIKELGEEPMKVSLPARSDLFNVDESKPLVDEGKKSCFTDLFAEQFFAQEEKERI